MEDKHKTENQFPAKLEPMNEDIAGSLEVLQSIVNKLPDVVYRIDIEGKITFISDAVRQFGHNPNDLMGCSVLDLVEPEYRESVANKINERRTGDRSTKNFEMRIIIPDGAPKYIEIRSTLDHSSPNVSLEAEGIWEEDKGDKIKFLGSQGVIRDITARKLAEEGLKESKSLLSSIIESPEDIIIFSIDRDYRYTSFNNAHSKEMKRVFDVDIELGERVLDYISDVEDHEKAKRNYDRVLLGERFTLIEEYGELGQRFTYESTYNPIADASQHVVGLTLFIKDITNRKHDEEALREKEATIRAIVESSQEWIWSIDLVGIHTFSNPAIENILGYRVDEIIGGVALDYLHPDDKEMIAANLPKWIAEKRGWSNLILRWRHKDGTYRILESNSVPILDAQDELRGFRGVDRDISERKEAEEALEKSEKELRNLYENAVEGIYRTAPDGSFLFANPAMAHMFGYDSVDDILRANAYDLYESPETRDKIKQDYADEEQPQVSKLKMKRKDGSGIWVRASWISITNDEDGSPKWTEGFMSDISESMKLEQELLRSQKLESVGHLAGGLAHDFNNALTTIQLQAALASLKDELPSTVRESLQAIEQSVTKAMGITQQMLTFSLGGAPVKEPANIGELIQETVNFALSGSNMTPVFEVDIDLHNSEVDKNQINQVVSNLVINAQHAMPAGGELKIVAKNISVTSRSQLGPLKPGEYIGISIEDQGHGIDPGNLGKIFDPYFTTKQQGSGLGLFSCYSIVDKHEGWMTADSVVSKGSVFTFYLPKSTKNLPKAAVGIKSQEIVKNSGKILIMDDELVLRRTLSELLNRTGYSATGAADGEEAIRVYSEAYETDAPFDLVILDLTIPKGMGGAETVSRLREIDPNVKAIVSSGYSNDSAVSDYKARGFNAVLPKPYSLNVLKEVVRSTMEEFRNRSQTDQQAALK